MTVFNPWIELTIYNSELLIMVNINNITDITGSDNPDEGPSYLRDSGDKPYKVKESYLEIFDMIKRKYK